MSVSPEAARLVGTILGGKYRILSVIGEGGMGAVYEAAPLAGGVNVAVKVLHPRHGFDTTALRRLGREARLAGALGHPNICRVLGLEELEGGTHYLLMELLVGETLRAHMARVRTMEVGAVVRMFLKILSALEATHAAGVVHRDVSSRNVFLVVDPDSGEIVPKLLDYGLSKRLAPPRAVAVDHDGDDMSTVLTAAGTLLGTPDYMAPEQVRGQDANAQTDVYACGAVMFEVLTGRPPFVAKTKLGLLQTILNAPLTPARSLRPELPEELDDVLAKALARNPGQRFADAAEFAAALHVVASSQACLVNPNASPTGTDMSLEIDVAWSAHGSEAAITQRLDTSLSAAEVDALLDLTKRQD